jgi:hypothetical protein
MTAFYIIFAFLATAAAALHFASVFAPRHNALFSYLNLALHVPFTAVQLLLGFELSLLALVMMSSVLLYLFLSFIRFKLTRGEGDR